eukprot:2358998-Alexandrium_andersonii.AAC.1
MPDPQDSDTPELQRSASSEMNAPTTPTEHSIVDSTPEPPAQSSKAASGEIGDTKGAAEASVQAPKVETNGKPLK